MTETVAPSYVGVFYHVRGAPDAMTWTLDKRQGTKLFSSYEVSRKYGHGNTWLECDAEPCVAFHDPTQCKHVKIVEAHLKTGQDESAVRWLK